jgi:hypothetical protein|tara:strand:- start:336 stop:578 length:243 start_codon:yes stop_codon:yes gene_type:complete
MEERERLIHFPKIDTSKEKEREYNMKEQAYYDKRARLDAISEATDKDWEDFWNGFASDEDFDLMLSQYGYEYTPKIDKKS